jgi:predicted metal-binding protein
MATKKALGKLFREHGFKDFKWLNPKDIKVAYWVRMKCQFGCDAYARKACCPPNMPPKTDCEEFFKEYSLGVVFHFEKKLSKPEDKRKWYKVLNPKLLELERQVFFLGYPKVFLMYMSHCIVCKDCVSNLNECRHPDKSRPTPEALCIDVFGTVRELGYTIEVLTDYKDTMNRYAFLLID